MLVSPSRRCAAALLVVLLALLGCAFTGPSATAADSAPAVGVVRDGNQLHVRGRPAGTGNSLKLRGTLHVITGEDGRADTFAVTANGHTVPITLPGMDASDVRSGDSFSGTVAAPEDATARQLRGSPSRVVNATITAQAATAPPDRKLLVAAMSNRGTVPTDAQILAATQSVAAYWLDESDGAIASFASSSTVKRYATTHTAAANACGLDPSHPDFTDLIDEARAQYPAAGLNDTVVVVVPEDCSDTGYVGYSTGGVTFNAGGDSMQSTVGHEEGHELGLGHANKYTCPDDCVFAEYDDYMSVMGASLGDVNMLTALNSAFRSVLGWTQPGDETVLALPPAQSSLTQDVTLLPRAAETGVRSVRVPDPDSAGSYFVEYRRAQDRDVNSALDGPDWCCEMYDAGVSVVYREAGQTQSVMYPTGPAEKYSLGPDDGTWTSPSGGLVLDVLQDNGAAGALVRVKVQSSNSSFATTPTPVLAGAALPGEEVTANLGTPSPAYTFVQYQWNLDGVAAPSWRGSDPSFSVFDTDIGKELSLTVYVSRPGYRVVPLTSNTITIGWVNPRTPTITGASTPWIGNTLTAVPGNWGSGVTFAYKWFAGATQVGTASQLVLTAAMAGQPVHVTVTGTSHGQSESRTSADTAAVQAPPAPPLSATVPTISGSPVVSRPLTAVRGAWTAGSTFAFQWLADDAPIAGATTNTFTPTAAEVGKTLKVKVTGTKAGYSNTVRTSAPTAAVTYAPWSPVVPTILGTPTYPNTLSTAPFWGSEGSYTYQWLNNGVAIAGATSAGYAPPASLVGHNLKVRVVGTHAGTPTSLLSVASKYAPGSLTGATPTITGTTKVGRTLTAVPGTWTTGTTRKYQWYAASTPIKSATSSTFKLTTAQKGKRVWVRVTGTKPGYTTLAKDSARTALVS